MAGRDKEIQRTGGNGRRSTCVAFGDLVFVSGITTVDLEADMAGQARDVLAQIDRLLAANGSGRNQVLKADVTLQSMEDYGAFNAVWDEWVEDGFEPARAVTQGGLALPGYRVKVAVVAAR